MSGRTAEGIGSAEDASVAEVLRRGIATSPVLVQGLPLTILLALIASGGQIIVPIVVQRALDTALSAPGGLSLSAIAGMVGLALLVVLATGTASWLMTSRLFGRAEHGLAELRLAGFRRVHALPLLVQRTEAHGSLVSRLTGDVDQISRFLVYGGVQGAMSVAQLAVATIVMLSYSPELTGVVWLCFVPLFAALPAIQRRLARVYADSRRHIGEMMSAVAESVVAVGTVRSYGAESRVVRRIRDAVGDFRRATIHSQSISASASAIGGVASGFALAGVMSVGAWLVAQQRVTPGEVVAFAFLAQLFIEPVQSGSRILTDMQGALAGWRRVIGILDTPADHPAVPERRRELPPGPPTIETVGVGLDYPGRPGALTDVTATFLAGSRIAVVGETGSGKSTFALLLAGLLTPSRGTVRLDGVDLREIDAAQLRARVTFVPQEGFLFHGTLRENLRYGRLDADDDELRRGFADLALEDWLESLPAGLDTDVGYRGSALSAGERQLVALLRARLRDPDLLILDEATSSIDPALTRRVATALERLMAGRTSVTITHRLSLAESADEVIVFDGGRIVQRGPHAQLRAQHGVYARLHGAWSRG
ncbi:MAG: ABC transporter ATP-binding protein [Micropruina sp.]|uniref:ABC transporter ATP-binding protein n=1 Tax=Micropruina sp. TaxID=2737536 RepID=UPI0039E47659